MLYVGHFSGFREGKVDVFTILVEASSLEGAVAKMQRYVTTATHPGGGGWLDSEMQVAADAIVEVYAIPRRGLCSFCYSFITGSVEPPTLTVAIPRTTARNATAYGFSEEEDDRGTHTVTPFLEVKLPRTKGRPSSARGGRQRREPRAQPSPRTKR
jgi:hypothetical protein